MFKTRVTEMLGIEYPIIQGGMHLVSSPEFVAAVSNAGGLGIISSATFTTGKELRDVIRKTKALTDKPFGINLSLFPAVLPVPNDEYVEVLTDEGVRAVETSGTRTPDEFMGRLKRAGVKVIHKCTAVRHARHAQSIGVDAVTLVGFEQGGALGTDDVTTLVLVPAAVDALSIPVIAAGGIADARGFVAALALGAEGVVIGTRFLATLESPVHPNLKEMMVKAKEVDTVIVERSIGNSHRALKNKASEKVLEMEAKGATLEDLLPITSGEQRKKAFYEGDVDAGMLYCGQDVGLIREVLSVKQVIEGIVKGTIDFQERLRRIIG